MDGKGLEEVMYRRGRQPAALLVISMLIYGAGGIMLVKLVTTGMDNQGTLDIQNRQHQHHR